MPRWMRAAGTETITPKIVTWAIAPAAPGPPPLPAAAIAAKLIVTT